MKNHPKNPLPTPKHGSTASCQGTVAQFLPNPRGEIDGMLLKDGTIVKFPPHLSRELALVAAPGAEITANGHLEGERLLKGHVIANLSSGHALRDIKPTPPDRAGKLPGLEPLQAQGVIQRVRLNGHGDADGAILADGTVLQFPPHAGKQLATLLAEGQRLCVAGFGTTGPHGRSVAVAMFGTTTDGLQMIAPPPAKPTKEHGKPGHDKKHRDEQDE